MTAKAMWMVACAGVLAVAGCKGGKNVESEDPGAEEATTEATTEDASEDAEAPQADAPATPEAAAATEAPEAAAWTPSETQEAMYKALSMRDAGPECDALSAMSQSPVEDLVALVEHAQQPPWVAMRAATCVASAHGEAAKPQLVAWMGDADTAGLATMLAGMIDQLPESVRVDVAEAGLNGPHEQKVRERLEKAESADVRGLVE